MGIIIDGPFKKAKRKEETIPVVFDGGALDVIDEIQKETGATKSDIIKEAITFFYFVFKQYIKGRTLAVIRNGKIEKHIEVSRFEKMLENK